MRFSGYSHRCSICNAVDNEDIETNVGDYKEIAFTVDPNSSLHYICLDCHDEIQEVLQEWEHEEYDND